MSLTGKLKGGWGIKREKANYLVFITHKNVHKFAGFLISKKHVLTAAYNLQNFWLDPVIPWFWDYYVIVGRFNESIPGNEHLIEQVERHRLYKPQNPKPGVNIGLITVNYSPREIWIQVLLDNYAIFQVKISEKNLNIEIYFFLAAAKS